MKVDSNLIKNLLTYVENQTNEILRKIKSEDMAENKDFFIKKIRELGKRVSILFKSGEMVLDVYKGAFSDGYNLKETFDSYGISIFECTNKIVSLLEKKSGNSMLDVVNECSDRMEIIDELPNVFKRHEKCLQTESMRNASKILLNLYDIIKCFAEQKGTLINELIDNRLLEKLENNFDELLLKAEPVFRKIDKFVVDLGVGNYSNKQSVFRKYSLKNELSNIKKVFVPYLSFSVDETTDTLANELSEWLNKCIIKLNEKNANIDSVVEISKSKIGKMESLILSIRKKFNKTKKLPQGLQLYFAILENILRLARALAGK